MANTKVYLLDGGSAVLDGLLYYWNTGPAGEIRLPMYSVLIEHADGLYLFDSGFDREYTVRNFPFVKAMQSPEQTIPGQLAKLGLSPADINYVINSHYHFDHCGGNKHLVNACTVCHKLELEACGCPQPFEVIAYSDLSFCPSLQEQRRQVAAEGSSAAPLAPEASDIYTPRFETVTGDQEIAKGVWLFETPGHTAGHYSLMVELSGRRPMIFTGDAVYGKRSLDLMCISSFHLDPVASLRSMRRIKDLAEQYDAEIFFSHDPSLYADYVKAPGGYA